MAVGCRNVRDASHSAAASQPFNHQIFSPPAPPLHRPHFRYSTRTTRLQSRQVSVPRQPARNHLTYERVPCVPSNPSMQHAPRTEIPTTPTTPCPAPTSFASRNPVIPSNKAIRLSFSPIPPPNVIPAKADASGATDEVNPASTTFRIYYHPSQEKIPLRRGTALRTRPAEQGRGMFTTVKTTATLQIRHESLRTRQGIPEAYTKACPPPNVMPGPAQASSQHNPKVVHRDTVRHTPNRSLEGAVAQATEGVL